MATTFIEQFEQAKRKNDAEREKLSKEDAVWREKSTADIRAALVKIMKDTGKETFQKSIISYLSDRPRDRYAGTFLFHFSLDGNNFAGINRTLAREVISGPAFTQEFANFVELLVASFYIRVCDSHGIESTSYHGSLDVHFVAK